MGQKESKHSSSGQSHNKKSNHNTHQHQHQHQQQLSPKLQQQQQQQSFQLPQPQQQQPTISDDIRIKEALQQFNPFKDQTTLVSDCQKFQSLEDDIIEYVKHNQGDQQKQQADNEAIQKSIHLDLITRYSTFKLSSSSVQTLPVMLSLITKQIEKLECNSPSRAPIDLVCVIDDSGSMSGQKATLVRKSLKYLLKILNQDDRICFITFENSAQIHTPFLRNNEVNKPQLKKAIHYIQGRGGTCIHSGFENALWMLQNRKKTNPVSCIFVLTDGVDNSKYADLNIKHLMEKYTMPEKYTVNCYGYGSDHDPEVLRRICKLGKGGFYYIEDLKKISEWFILSLSGLLTVLAENVEIWVKPVDFCSVSKRFGDKCVWGQDYSIKLPYLVQDDRKEYFMEIEIPKSKKSLSDNERKQVLLRVELQAKSLSGQMLNLSANLSITFYNHDEVLELEKISNERLEVGYIRAKGGEAIGAACELAKQGKYEDANIILDDILKEIAGNEYREKQGMVFIQNDVIKSKEVCKPQIFEQKGKAFMYKKEQDHLERRASLCCMEDWNECQQQVFQDYNDGKMCLSDDSDSDGDNNNKHKQKGRKHSGHMMQRNNSGNMQHSGGNSPVHSGPIYSPPLSPVAIKQQQQIQNVQNVQNIQNVIIKE